MKTIGKTTDIAYFAETKERIEITMGGWDGTGYNGEGKKMNVWVLNTMPGVKFVCKYMARWKSYCILRVTEDKHEVTGLPQVEFYGDYDKSQLYK